MVCGHRVPFGSHKGPPGSFGICNRKGMQESVKRYLEDFLPSYTLPRRRESSASTRGIQENRWYVFLFNFYEYIASHQQHLQCFYFVVFSASMMLTTSDFDYAPFLTVLQIAMRSAKMLRKSDKK